MRGMEAPHQTITDAELIEIARGMACDTATVFEDAARRVPQHAFTLYRLAGEMRTVSRDLAHVPTPTTDASPSHSARA